MTDSSDTGTPVPLDDAALESAVVRLGTDFIDRARKRRAGVLSAAFWSDKLMDWAMKDEAFKIQLFRFVDTFPRLATPKQVHEHLVDYLDQPGVTLPPGLSIGLKAGGLLKGAMTRTLTGQITSMAEKFIAGTDAASARPVLRTLWDRGIAFSLDLLGEASVSEPEAAVYQQRYLDLVRELPAYLKGWPTREVLEHDHIGPIPRANVSIKISSLRASVDPIDTEGAIAALIDILQPILEEAKQHDVFINFDMEQYELKDLTLDLFMQCCERFDFEAGIAMQAYLRSGDDDAQRLVKWSKSTGRQVTARLVKGAYWDFETINAEEFGWPIPVWSRKADTDACFERMTRQFIETMPRTASDGGVRLALGSHNARSIATALALLERHELPSSAIELQMLHGMGDPLKDAAVEMGLRVREYAPVGEMIPGMAYLVRRLLENTSNESWLRAGFAENVSAADLLASPHRRWSLPDPGVDRIARAATHHALSPAIPGVGNGLPFINEPPRNFAIASTRAAFAEAVRDHRPWSRHSTATTAEAKKAIAKASDALTSWRVTPVLDRAAVLIEIAKRLRGRRDALAAAIIDEAGKTWREADAEVCEAIDHCEYYARSAADLFAPRRLGRFLGEHNAVLHQPRGVAVVLSPWNFPLAQLCGMSCAAIVTGNPTIVVPAMATPNIARVFHEIARDSGCPADVLQVVCGPDSVATALVRDPRTAVVTFSGERERGLQVLADAGSLVEGSRRVKKVIAGMGGKNAIIVDESADLDEAVLAVRTSAFAYQGQKTAACSRAIVHAACYDAFLHRLVASTSGMRVGNPADPRVSVGPVIDAERATRIHEYIEIGKGEARLALAVELPDRAHLAPGRQYVTPHIFAEVPPAARLSHEVIFGPVLAVTKAGDFREAMDLATDAEHLLTGGVYSRKPSNIDLARAEFRVGNLYVNRPITGSLVGRQPYGGFGLSGAGTKAGGPDYLLHFVEPRSVCENTMRRGFAPEL